MNTGALGAALDSWVPIATLVVTLSGGALAWYTANNSRRFGISGDEREVRRVELEDRRDTIADRDNLILAFEKRLGSVEERYAEALDRIAELEQREDDTRTMLMLHAAWDWQAIELAREGGVILPPPPPLMAPRVPRARDH